MSIELGLYWGEGCRLYLLAHYPCYRPTINSTRTLFGDGASRTDHVVIYGIDLGYGNELKMQSRPEPDNGIQKGLQV